MKAIELLGYWEHIRERLDLTVKLGYVQIYTASLNSSIESLGSSFRTTFRRWFSLGSAFAVFIPAFAILLLLYNLFLSCYSLFPFLLDHLSASSSSSPSASPSSSSSPSSIPDFGVMTPIIPGINLPTAHLLPFFLAIFLAAVFHELGHALAATAEGIRLNGFGVFLMAIYPGAFADLSTQLLQLSHYDQLKVFAAGAFHNFVAAILAFMCILLLPFLLSPLFAQNTSSLVVTHVHPLSPVASHIRPGDEISQLNRCSLEGGDVQAWTRCMKQIEEDPIEGFCMPHEFVVDQKDLHGTSCCITNPINNYNNNNHNNNNNNENNHDEPPKTHLQCFALSAFSQPTLCTSARAAADRFAQCSSKEDCEEGYLCAVPALSQSEKLVKIQKVEEGDFVLYAGQLPALGYSIDISSYRSRFPVFDLFLSFPHFVYLFFYYLVALSTALGVLNLVPAYWLDGEHILSCLLNILIADDVFRSKLRLFILRFSSLLLLSNMICAFIILYYRTGYEL